MNYGSGDTSDGIFYLIFLGAVIGWGIWRAWQHRHSAISGPLLVSLYTYRTGLMQMSNGHINGYPYNLMVTTAPQGTSMSDQSLDAVGLAANNAGNEGTTILVLDLPFISEVHIVAIGSVQSRFDALVARAQLNNSVTRVELEGDFPNYFNLFCDAGHQVELRQMLDPATMAFLVDFSEENDWEVYGNCLYMVRRDGVHAKSESNDTPMPEDAVNLADRITPTLRRLTQPTTIPPAQ